jgi:DNA/RNA endonuclease YhcR with UshA esterase domain
LYLGARNPLIYQKLAGLVEGVQPETASLYRRIASESGLTNPAPIAGLAADTQTPPAVADAGPVEEVAPLEVEKLLQHEGRRIRAAGKILKYARNNTGNIQYLNFAENYRAALSLVFKTTEGAPEFTPDTLAVFTNKTVEVEGQIINYRGAPEIEITSLAQIKIVDEATALPAPPATNLAVPAPGPPAAAVADASQPLDGRDGEPFLKREGQLAKVKGRLVRFGAAASAQVYYLDFTENYRSGLALVFFGANNPAEFRPELLRALVGKTVVFEGKVSTCQGRPQMEVKSLADLKIVEDPAPSPATE